MLYGVRRRSRLSYRHDHRGSRTPPRAGSRNLLTSCRRVVGLPILYTIQQDPIQHLLQQKAAVSRDTSSTPCYALTVLYHQYSNTAYSYSCTAHAVSYIIQPIHHTARYIPPLPLNRSRLYKMNSWINISYNAIPPTCWS